MTEANRTEDQRPKRDERSGADRCWIYRDGFHYAQVTFSKPDTRLYPTAVEYMRVMQWKEIEKLAATEGIEPDRYISVLHARSEAQRREIARLNEALRRKISDEAPSFSPNFDERNGIR
jgi:hypothetical protein